MVENETEFRTRHLAGPLIKANLTVADSTVHGKITYEQPLNERIRTFLRLEFLFKQVKHHLHGRTPWDSRAALGSLLDILNIFTRADLKTEVMKELERQIASMSRLEQAPNIDHSRLNEILDHMDVLVDRLHAIQGQVGQQLKQNEFLTSIRQRSSIPGGTCDFDLPAYHYWLQQPAEVRLHELEQWLNEFEAMQSSIGMILHLVRESSVPLKEVAHSGFFQQSLDTAIPFQLIRVTVDREINFYAEISGGKHRFTVRFMEQRADDRAVQAEQDIPFELTCCAL